MLKMCQNEMEDLNGNLEQVLGSKSRRQRRRGLLSYTCNRKLEISTAPTEAKSGEPAYSQTLTPKKLIVRCSDSGKQTVTRLWWMVFGVETGRGYRDKRMVACVLVTL